MKLELMLWTFSTGVWAGAAGLAATNRLVRMLAAVAVVCAVVGFVAAVLG